MEEDRKARLKKSLLERKRRMWNELRDDVFRKLGREYNSQFDAPNDLEDLSVIDMAEDLGLTVSDIRKEELTRLDESLRKLDEGTYGICEMCSSEIDEDRLRADPSVTSCLKCQSGLEKGRRKPSL